MSIDLSRQCFKSRSTGCLQHSYVYNVTTSLFHALSTSLSFIQTIRYVLEIHPECSAKLSEKENMLSGEQVCMPRYLLNLVLNLNCASFSFFVRFIPKKWFFFHQGFFSPRISVGKRVRSCSSFGILCTNPGFTVCY